MSTPKCHRLRRSRVSNQWPVLLTIGALLFASSCVLPEDQQASELQDIPPGLFTTTTGVPTTSEPVPAQSFELALYWHDGDGQLVRVNRLLDNPPTFDDALINLVDGPNAEEVLLDGALISPRVVAALAPIATLSDNEVLVITVADSFSFRELADQKIPITEELVCTLTGLDGVTAIRIEDSLGEIALTNIEASPIGAATRADFADCVTQSEATENSEEDSNENEGS